MAPPKTKTFHPTLLLIFVFFKATATTTKSIAIFNHQTYQTHRLHLVPVASTAMPTSGGSLPHLLSPPGVTSSFAFRLVRSAFFAALLGLQCGAAAAAGTAGRRWRRWWPAEVMGDGGAVKGTGRDGRDGHLAWLSFFNGRKYDKPKSNTLGFCRLCGGVCRVKCDRNPQKSWKAEILNSKWLDMTFLIQGFYMDCNGVILRYWIIHLQLRDVPRILKVYILFILFASRSHGWIGIMFKHVGWSCW